jgi:ElaB/YqjD/DUF883 family membrane-anchored ribosome-binding protein
MQNGAAAKLVSDFKVLIDDAEGLVKATANQAAGRIGDLRQRLGKTFEDRKKTLTACDKAWLETAESAKTQIESYLREHAWGALLVAAGVGALFGLLLRRR